MLASCLGFGGFGRRVGLNDLAHLVAGRGKQSQDQESDDNDQNDAEGWAQPAKFKAFIFLLRLGTRIRIESANEFHLNL